MPENETPDITESMTCAGVSEKMAVEYIVFSGSMEGAHYQSQEEAVAHAERIPEADRPSVLVLATSSAHRIYQGVWPALGIPSIFGLPAPNREIAKEGLRIEFDGDEVTIAELIAALQKFPPDATIGCHASCCPHPHPPKFIEFDAESDFDVTIDVR